MTPKMTQHGAQLGPFGESFGSFLETKKMMKKKVKTGYAVEPDPGAVGPSNKTIRPPGDDLNTPKACLAARWRILYYTIIYSLILYSILSYHVIVY